MKIVYIFLIATPFYIACSTENASKTENDESEQSAKNEIQKVPPTFDIETQTDENGTPKSIVPVFVGVNKLKITEVKTCEKIAKEDYATYQIPEEAIAACGGRRAGAGDYFYMIDNGNDNYTIMQGSVDERQTTDSYNYKMVMNLSDRSKPKSGD